MRYDDASGSSDKLCLYVAHLSLVAFEFHFHKSPDFSENFESWVLFGLGLNYSKKLNSVPQSEFPDEMPSSLAYC